METALPVADDSRRRAVAVIVAIVLLAALVAVFSVDGDGDEDDTLTAGGRDTTTSLDATGSSIEVGASTTVPGVGVSTTPGGATPDTTARPGAATTAAPGGGGNLGAPGDPGPATPPKNGSYRYDLKTESGNESDSQRTTLVVSTAAGSAPNDVRQTHRESTNEGEQVQEQAWRPNGVFVLKQTFNFGGASAECDWNPDLLLLSLPLSTGKEWTFEGSCNTTLFGQPTTLHVKGSAKITGTERTRVGGEVVDVWLASGTAVIDGTVAGQSFKIDQEQTSKIAPRHGLEVHGKTTQRTTSPQGSATVVSERTLIGLQPA